MTGIVREREQKLLAVHCMPDHAGSMTKGLSD
jgi:hypothetical protein